MERMYCLYTVMSVSLCCPNVVPVNDLSVFSLGRHFMTMLLTCEANDMEVLYVTQRSFVSCTIPLAHETKLIGVTYNTCM